MSDPKSANGGKRINKSLKKGTSVVINPKKEELMQEKLDPVGQEDSDIDNDGKKNDKNDKYLRNRRKVRGKVIKMREEALAELRNKSKKKAEPACEEVESVEEEEVKKEDSQYGYDSKGNSLNPKDKGKNVKKKALKEEEVKPSSNEELQKAQAELRENLKLRMMRQMTEDHDRKYRGIFVEE